MRKSDMSNKKNLLSSRLYSSYLVTKNILLITSFTALYACSGDSQVSDSSSSVVIDGTVLTSNASLPISNTTEVFLDSNQNFQLDSGEIVAATQPYVGQFKLAIPALNSEQLENSFLVARSRPNTQSSYYFASPLSAYVSPQPEGGFSTQAAIISPLTTLVVAEMMSNQLNREEAIQNLKPITKNINPLENYSLSQNAEALQLAYEIGKQWSAVTSSEVSPLQTIHTNGEFAKSTLYAQSFPAESKNLFSSHLASPSVTTSSLTPIAGSSFVVVYKQGGAGNASDLATSNSLTEMQITGQQVARKYGGVFKYAYSSAIRGFALAIPNTKVTEFVDGMQRNPNVDFIEEDVIVSTNLSTQLQSSWGLDRIDQMSLPLNKTYNYQFDGSGVNAYIVDTGLNDTHEEFANRVKPGFSAILDGKGTTDCKGHGTHVAGTLGGKTYGVAKNVNIIPVKVFDCNGNSSLSGILAGIDWIIQNGRLPAVINMSLGASVNNTFDQAAAAAFNAGFVVVASAGNYAGLACNQSPAREPSVITVGSSDIDDAKSYYSNFGVCVDLFAPGSNIPSAWIGSNSAINTISGTSMSSPHVAGVAALYLQSNPKASPQQITYALLNSTQAKLIGNLGVSSPNRLLNINNTPDFTPINQPIYVPPITSPVPPSPAPEPEKPTKAFRIISIKSITATRVKVSKTTWKTNVVISVFSPNNGPLDETAVKASFSIGGSNLSCTTNVSGVCSITSGIISNTKTSTIITISGVTGESLAYLKRTNKINTLTIKRP